jgi:hypothetical protein
VQREREMREKGAGEVEGWVHNAHKKEKKKRREKK